VNVTDTAKALSAFVSGTSLIFEELNDNGATSALSVAALQNSSGFRISITYITT
jgi:hypothetical protein